MRKEKLVTGEVYHIYDKSIAGFEIFNNDSAFLRILDTVRYYQRENPQIAFSGFLRLPKETAIGVFDINMPIAEEKKLVEVIAYCIMPTHIHLILKQLKEEGISNFMSLALNSYTRYFNMKCKRKGPLWQGRFENVRVKTDEQLIHLTRYIHLNPTTAFLVDKPEDWPWSSYLEYLKPPDVNRRFCNYTKILDINPDSYRKFVEDRISYQRDLGKIKDMLVD